MTRWMFCHVVALPPSIHPSLCLLPIMSHPILLSFSLYLVPSRGNGNPIMLHHDEYITRKHVRHTQHVWTHIIIMSPCIGYQHPYHRWYHGTWYTSIFHRIFLIPSQWINCLIFISTLHWFHDFMVDIIHTSHPDDGTTIHVCGDVTQMIWRKQQWNICICVHSNG